MIYLIGMLAGFANGFFTCGAGQIIIFYLVFIKKNDTHRSRATSIAAVSLTSLVSLALYLNKVKIDLFKAFVTVAVSLTLGFLASKIMSKFNSKYLNLISGILMTVLAIISIMRG